MQSFGGATVEARSGEVDRKRPVIGLDGADGIRRHLFGAVGPVEAAAGAKQRTSHLQFSGAM